MVEPAPRDPQTPFTPSDLKSIQLAIDWLSEFHAGYVFIEQERRCGDIEDNSPLDRFFTMALLAFVDGYYPRDRTRGLWPVIRLVGCKTIADEVAAAMDRKIGSSTYREITRKFRNKVLAHVDFTRKAMQPFSNTFERDLSTLESEVAFGESTHTVNEGTARLYLWFRRSYPQFFNEPDRPVVDGP